MGRLGIFGPEEHLELVEGTILEMISFRSENERILPEQIACSQDLRRASAQIQAETV